MRNTQKLRRLVFMVACECGTWFFLPCRAVFFPRVLVGADAGAPDAPFSGSSALSPGVFSLVLANVDVGVGAGVSVELIGVFWGVSGVCSCFLARGVSCVFVGFLFWGMVGVRVVLGLVPVVDSVFFLVLWSVFGFVLFLGAAAFSGLGLLVASTIWGVFSLVVLPVSRLGFPAAGFLSCGSFTV